MHGLGSSDTETDRVRLLCWSRGWAAATDLLVLPPKPSNVAIPHEARPCKPVELSRVDDQLSRRADAAHRLVHLLASLQRHIEILVSSHKERRCLDAVSM